MSVALSSFEIRKYKKIQKPNREKHPEGRYANLMSPQNQSRWRSAAERQHSNVCLYFFKDHLCSFLFIICSTNLMFRYLNNGGTFITKIKYSYLNVSFLRNSVLLAAVPPYFFFFEDKLKMAL